MKSNKEWSDLSMRQREWISQVAYEEQAAFVKEHGRLPMKKRKQVVVDRVMQRVQERGILIPAQEVKQNIGKYIDRANHKSPLWNNEDQAEQ